MSKKVVLAGACRTAIGKMGGALSTTPAPKLGSIVIEEALKRAGVPKDAVDHVYSHARFPLYIMSFCPVLSWTFAVLQFVF